MSDESKLVQEDLDVLTEVELRLLYSLGSLGHESAPAIPRAENAELARKLALRGMLSCVEGSDPRVRRFGCYTLTARGYEAFNRRASRGSSNQAEALPARHTYH
ncbi:MAG TPA: hypothetical protein VNX47_01015 [Nevskia sp.]|nr:hypothetical protein [Nevskia sp.]